MSQHDMDIANQAGAAFRADLNNALVALAGNNSGATAPATTFPYMWWPDTTTGIMKQRNAANTAWLDRWQLSGGELAALSGATFTGTVKLASGANIASAATIDLSAVTDGNTIGITGTTATSALTMSDGQHMTLMAAAAWPLTYNAATLKLMGGQNITLAAGDKLHCWKTGGVVYGVVEFLTKYYSSSVAQASAVALTTNVDKTVTSLLLPAGNWVVSGTLGFIQTGTTTYTRRAGGSSTTADSVDTVEGYQETPPTGAPGAIGLRVAIPTKRYSFSSPTTVYLAAAAQFAVSTASAYGTIIAERE